MLNFRSTRVVPPGGRYFYRLGEEDFEAFTLRDLVAMVRRYHLKHEIDLPLDLKAVIVDHMCRKLPEDFCYGELDGAPRAKVLTMALIRKVTMDKAASCERASLVEAKRRSIICANCPCNDRTMCPTCVGLTAWSRRLVGQQLGAREEWIGVCTVDGTSLAAMVHLEDKNAEGDFPEGCWRSK